MSAARIEMNHVAMLVAIIIVLLFSASAFSQAGHQEDSSGCLRTSFGGRVNGGEPFSQSLGNGLVLHLGPLKDDWGWQLTISPLGSDDDWAYPVNPPLRFGNSEYLGTGYSESASQVLSYTHVIRFPLTAADYGRIFKLAEDALWPYESKKPDEATSAFLNALKTIKTGAVILSPLDYDKEGPPLKVRWMKFSAVVIVPKGFRGDTKLDWTKGSCSPNLPSREYR